MRGVKNFVRVSTLLGCTMLLLLSGCGRTKNTDASLSESPSQQISEIEIEEVQDPSPTQNTISSPSDQVAISPTPAGSAAPSISSGEVQANTALVDALIQELDDMGSLLDSLDDPQDSDFVLPQPLEE